MSGNDCRILAPERCDSERHGYAVITTGVDGIATCRSGAADYTETIWKFICVNTHSFKSGDQDRNTVAFLGSEFRGAMDN